ncbi:hypothetical protein OEZ86_001442 [Tetradesmus obliquus]|nr:hypothetical protein OEZ86_001442 [Tetradesmus obliquus]
MSSNGVLLARPPSAAAAAALRIRTSASSSSLAVVESAPSNSNDLASYALLRSAQPSSSAGLVLSPNSSSSSNMQRWSQMWFEAMVQTVVKQLDGAPFILKTRDLQDSLQGCYLLKTMQLSQHHGGGAGCHCTHYSLNRVCQGPSLQQQFQASWLV